MQQEEPTSPAHHNWCHNCGEIFTIDAQGQAHHIDEEGNVLDERDDDHLPYTLSGKYESHHIKRLGLIKGHRGLGGLSYLLLPTLAGIMDSSAMGDLEMVQSREERDPPPRLSNGINEWMAGAHARMDRREYTPGPGGPGRVNTVPSPPKPGPPNPPDTGRQKKRCIPKKGGRRQ